MVFAVELDRDRHPIGTRVWGVFTGTVLMIALVVDLAHPRAIATAMPIIGAALLFAQWMQGREILAGFRRVGVRTGPVVVFIILGIASALWSGMPLVSLKAGGAAMLWMGLCSAMVAGVLNEPRRNLFHMAEGLWIGLIAGLVYLFIELVTDQAVRLYLYNALGVPKSWLRPQEFFTFDGDRLVAISPGDLTRSIAPITLLMWSAILALRVTAPKGAFVAAASLFYALVAIVVVLSSHETSKAALLASTIVFLMSYKNSVWGAWILRVGWVAACLLVIPVVLGLYRLDLQNARWVQPTLQHRIVIWNRTAENTMKSPVLGIGAGMMRELEPAATAQNDGEQFPPNANHAHNVYLQTWFEFGVVGATILTLIGLGIIERIGKLRPVYHPYGHASFAAAMSMAAASYGMWQTWFMAMFALAIFCFALALRVNTREPAPPDEAAFPAD